MIIWLYDYFVLHSYWLESTTYFARAIWFLEENDLIHGLIRCHNLIVSCYSTTSLKVKLSDPLGECDRYRDAPWIAPEMKEKGIEASSSSSDVFAFGTTLWEVFSYGNKPTGDNVFHLFQPIACPAEIWTLIQKCWVDNANDRAQPQTINRDMQNIFFEVYNSRHINCYSTPYYGREEKAQKHFFRSFLSKHASTLSLTRSSMTSTNTLFTGIDSSQSDILSIGNDSLDGSFPAPNVDSWLIEANQLTLGKVLGQVVINFWPVLINNDSLIIHLIHLIIHLIIPFIKRAATAR